MSENPEGLLLPFSKQAAQFTWLIVDVFFLFVLLLFFTFYNEMANDAMTRQFFRLYLVFCIGHVLISGLHLLSYHRHDDAQMIAKATTPEYKYRQFPSWLSYGLYILKLMWFAAFIYIAIQTNLIPSLV